MIQSHRSPRLTILPPPTDVPQDVAVRHILETELPPLPDPHTHTRDDVNHRRENDGRRKTTTTANDERRFVNYDDDETEHMFLPTQAAIASTPGRRAMNNNGGGFDVYERGVDAIHAATARWSQSPPPYRHRDHDHHRRLHEEESEERLPRTRRDSRQSTSPYSPAFAAGLRAASAPRAGRTTRGRDVSPSSSRRYHRDDADAVYVNRLRRNKSSSMDRTFSGRDSGYSVGHLSSTRRHHDAASECRPAWGGSGRVAPGSAERASHSASALRRLADPEVASAKAERAAAVAAAAERKAVERMAAARAKQKGKGGQSKGAAWQPPRKPSDAARPKPFGLTLTPDKVGKNISHGRSPTPPPTNTSFSPGSSGRARWTESDKVEDRLRRDWVLREARREARHVETMELEKSKTRKTLLETNPFAVNHPVNVPASRTEAHGRHLHARGMQRAARITESHVTSPSTLRAGMSPVGMGGEFFFIFA